MVAVSALEGLRRMPFARLFLLFSSGIAMGTHIDFPTMLLHILSLLSLTIIVSLFLFTFFCRSLVVSFSPTLVSLCFVFFGIVSVAYRLPAHQVKGLSNGKAEVLIGVIVDEPTTREKTIRFSVKITQAQVGKHRFATSASVMVSVARKNDSTSFFYGDKIAMVNKLHHIPRAYNPNQFDYQRYCAHKNIYEQAFLQQGEYTILARDQGNYFVGTALKLRHKLNAKFERFVHDRESLGVCAALIFGHRSDFSSEVLQTFSETGTIHVLSVSGMHVSIVFFLLNLVLSPLKKYKYGRLIRFVVILISIWSYVVLTGMAPSILRAGLMISFLLIADLGKRSHGSVNSLFASAFFLILFDPFMLFDVGFQLSYSAVFGLFTLYPLLRSMFRVRQILLRAVVELVWVSVAAQLFTMPLALYYFHQFPTYFLLGNLLIAVPSTLLMYLGILLALSPSITLNIWLGKSLVFLCDAMLRGLHWIQELPISVVRGIHLHEIDMVLFMAVLCFLLWTWYSRKKSVLFAFLSAILFLSASRVLQQLRVQMFQGIKVYNAQRDVALAVIDAGRVAVVSTLDSLEHPRLKNLVWTDLLIYAERSGISFHKITLPLGEARFIDTPFGEIALVNQFYDMARLESASWIVVRNVRATDSDVFAAVEPKGALIFDGSNNVEVIRSMVDVDQLTHMRYYVLKDNFAYVWEKSD